jgi:NAD(P)-dependent dehydrogenase (short-subunit alcohol dehydrogenase family)
MALGGLGPYTVAKHGVLGLSDVLRAELERLDVPVGVSVVMPGMVRTAMNPVGSVEPDAVAANVLDAIRRQRPYVFTDHHSTEAVEVRLRAILAARGTSSGREARRSSLEGTEGGDTTSIGGPYDLRAPSVE